MKHLLFRLVMASSVVAVAPAMTGCNSILDKIAESIESALMERMDIEGAKSKEGDPPKEHEGDDDFPQVEELEAVKELRLGQKFEFRMRTFAKPADIRRAIFRVKGAKDYLEVDTDIEPAPGGGYMARIVGSLKATKDELAKGEGGDNDDDDRDDQDDDSKQKTASGDSPDISGKSFDVDFGFINKDGKAGNYLRHKMKISSKPAVLCPSAAQCDDRSCGRDPLCGSSCGSCDDADQCDYGGSCVSANCLATGCDDNETCDPVSGACEEDERESCSEDSCDEGWSCNDDSGECEEEEEKQVAANCQEDGCDDNETCDPVSLECRGTTCEDTGCSDDYQSCNEDSGKCECDTSKCEGNLSCDTESNKCVNSCDLMTCDEGQTCNSKTGACETPTCQETGCDEGQTCNAGTGACESSVAGCNPLNDNVCDEGEGCVLSNGAFVCQASATGDGGDSGAVCSTTTEDPALCASGNACVGNDFYRNCKGDSCCAQYCDVTGMTKTCGEGFTCTAHQEYASVDDLIGICNPDVVATVTTCNALNRSAACDSVDNCAWSAADEDFICTTVDSATTQGGVCQGQSTCQLGYGCIDDVSYGSSCEGDNCCAQLCNPTIANPGCPGGTACSVPSTWSTFEEEVGTCVPETQSSASICRADLQWTCTTDVDSGTCDCAALGPNMEALTITNVGQIECFVDGGMVGDGSAMTECTPEAAVAATEEWNCFCAN